MGYIAAKHFTYAGRTYQPGDPWEPSGARTDEMMIKQRMVIDPATDPHLKRQRAHQERPATVQRGRPRKAA